MASLNSGKKNPGVNIIADNTNKNSSLSYVYRTYDNDVVVDDIISYRRDGEEIVIHRLVRRFGNKLITKGDANNTVDFALAEEHNIIGEVIFKIPKVGYIQEILATKGGLVIFIFIPCLGVLSYDVVKMIKKMGKKSKKSETTVVRR